MQLLKWNATKTDILAMHCTINCGKHSASSEYPVCGNENKRNWWVQQQNRDVSLSFIEMCCVILSVQQMSACISLCATCITESGKWQGIVAVTGLKFISSWRCINKRGCEVYASRTRCFPILNGKSALNMFW